MQTELLSPAGDIEAAYSAFYFGADAVYLGLRQFSARAEAVNFTPAELDEITAYAHSIGKKVYVAVNTVMQESELPALLETLAVCEQCRVDAVIVQDWGVARLIRRVFPTLVLHASTQMAIHNLAGALAMKRMGFSRVVLARELSLPEIRQIQAESGLEVEVFIHGALCYSYSGLCLFSSMTTGRSANRGKCVYSCRDTFRLNGRQYHPFSMKDLALEKEVLKLPGLSLKIEGRKKTALYVGAVTDYYRRILDTGKIDAGLTDNLKQIFARPWTQLHFKGKNKAVTEPDFVGHRGLPIGTVDRVFSHTITFKPTRAVARYDGIQIDVPGSEKPFGFSAENLVVGGKKVFEASAGQTVTLTLPPHHPFIQKGSPVYLSSSTRVKGAYPYTKPRPGAFKNRTPLDIDVFIAANRVTACANGTSVSIDGSFTTAQQPEKTRTAIEKAFAKTGETSFSLGMLQVHNADDLFVPASVLNELRRQLYEAVILPERPIELPSTPVRTKPTTDPKWSIKTDDWDLARHLNPADYDELTLVITPRTTPADLAGFPADKVRLALPVIMRPEKPFAAVVSTLVQAGFHKWEIANPAGLTLVPKQADIALDGMVPILNTQAAAMADELGIGRVTLSVEDTADNVASLVSRIKSVCLIRYQDVPLFLSANCVRENDCRDCPRGRIEMSMTNGKGSFTVISENCQTVVTDNRPYYIKEAPPADWYRIDFCYRRYTPDQAKDVVKTVKTGGEINHSFDGNFHKRFAT